ncbi:hypothetical protein ADUPG1_014134, partial [Aduncisulcus paluster]
TKPPSHMGTTSSLAKSSLHHTQLATSSSSSSGTSMVVDEVNGWTDGVDTVGGMSEQKQGIIDSKSQHSLVVSVPRVASNTGASELGRTKRRQHFKGEIKSLDWGNGEIMGGKDAFIILEDDDGDDISFNPLLETQIVELRNRIDSLVAINRSLKKSNSDLVRKLLKENAMRATGEQPVRSSVTSSHSVSPAVKPQLSKGARQSFSMDILDTEYAKSERQLSRDQALHQSIAAQSMNNLSSLFSESLSSLARPTPVLPQPPVTSITKEEVFQNLSSSYAALHSQYVELQAILEQADARMREMQQRSDLERVERMEGVLCDILFYMRNKSTAGAEMWSRKAELEELIGQMIPIKESPPQRPAEIDGDQKRQTDKESSVELSLGIGHSPQGLSEAGIGPSSSSASNLSICSLSYQLARQKHLLKKEKDKTHALEEQLAVSRGEIFSLRSSMSSLRTSSEYSTKELINVQDELGELKLKLEQTNTGFVTQVKANEILRQECDILHGKLSILERDAARSAAEVKDADNSDVESQLVSRRVSDSSVSGLAYGSPAFSSHHNVEHSSLSHVSTVSSPFRAAMRKSLKSVNKKCHSCDSLAHTLLLAEKTIERDKLEHAKEVLKFRSTITMLREELVEKERSLGEIGDKLLDAQMETIARLQADGIQ